MPRRLFFALILLVVAPLVLLGWMSANEVKARQAAAKENLANLLSSQLDDADRGVLGLFQSYAEQLDEAFRVKAPVLTTLRTIRRDNPIVRQGIYVDADGLILFPGPEDLLGEDGAEVAAALPGIVDARPLQSRAGESTTRSGVSSNRPSPESMNRLVAAKGKASLVVQSAWQQWFMGGGAQVIYWKLQPDGAAIGVLLERSRWLSDLIALLPDDPVRGEANIDYRNRATKASGKVTYASTPIGTVSLVDESKRLIYHWGADLMRDLPPLAERGLSPPLSSWKLRLHTREDLVPQDASLSIYISLGGIAVLLLSVGTYVLTSVQRQIENAKSRVSFAGQVSHELRTPLTNIRLYTELAESDLSKIDEGDAKDSLNRRLKVIEQESRRLQRLVSGVLEMIRPSGKRTGVRPVETDIQELLEGVIEQFSPSFQAVDISVTVRNTVTDVVKIDPDVIEMVLVNLLSNVEKYVPAGNRCLVESEWISRTGGSKTLRVVVQDSGPGIAEPNARKIFRPFVRLNDSINAPSGTGIGLTIARRAARRHDGELRLLPFSELGGAAFELTVPVNRSSEEDT